MGADERGAEIGDGASTDGLTVEELVDYELGGETGSANEAVGDPFFVSKKSAAVFKHALLKNYFPKFAGKTASTETSKRLVYVDTHAGPGLYEDGTPGSPLLIARNVSGMLGASGAAHRNIASVFVEARPDSHLRLEAVLRANMPEGAEWRAQRGKASAHLGEALKFAGDDPLFMFIDPYGLGPSFDEVVRVLTRPRKGWGSKTEILLNFISMAFSRAGGFLNTESPTGQQQTTLDRLDAVLGGPWWRQVYLKHSSGGRAVEELVNGYAQRLCAVVNERIRAVSKGKCQATLIPVRNTPEQDIPVYWLVHFTFHPHGRWCIAEAAAKANATWRENNHQIALSKRLALEAQGDQGDLFGGALIPEITQGEYERIERQRHEEWTGQIEANLEQLVRTRGHVNVCDDMALIFGATLGLAEGKHLKKAWERLSKHGLVRPRDTKVVIEKQSIWRA
ncbi:three-Cys-motif partner protein TcmP [Actinokineospora sp. 24-640]